MPALAPKWEAVAIALANGDTQKNAYIQAGYKYDRASATRMCMKPEIQARVTEIVTERNQQESRINQIAAQEAGMDRAWWNRCLKATIHGAIRGDPVRDATGRKRIDPDTKEIIYKPDRSAAVRGLELVARANGWLIERAEIGGPGDFARLNDTELQAKLVELGSALGVPEDVIRQLEWKPQEAAE